MDYSEIAELAVMKPVPFQVQMRTCPKCGWGPSKRPGFLIRWFDIPHAAFKVSWCPGSQDLEKVTKIVTLSGEVDHKYNPVCAGVSENHLHLSCTHCGFHFLMETRDAHAR
jgi:ribosomal protein L37E